MYTFECYVGHNLVHSFVFIEKKNTHEFGYMYLQYIFIFERVYKELKKSVNILK